MIELLFASWVIFQAFLSSADFFQKQLYSKKTLSGIPSECQIVLDPDQTQHFVRLDQGPNCLQKSYQQMTLGDKELT